MILLVWRYSLKCLGLVNTWAVFYFRWSHQVTIPKNATYTSHVQMQTSIVTCFCVLTAWRRMLHAHRMDSAAQELSVHTEDARKALRKERKVGSYIDARVPLKIFFQENYNGDAFCPLELHYLWNTRIFNKKQTLWHQPGCFLILRQI